MPSIGSAGQSAADRAKRSRAKADRLLRDAENHEKGAVGERSIGDILAQLPSDYWVLHDLNIPGSKANVDHLVVGPGGAIAIDAKAYGGSLRLNDGTLWRGKSPIRRECATALWESGEVSKWVGYPVQTVLAFVGTTLPTPVVELADVTACSSDALIGFLLGLPGRLDAAGVSAVARRAAELVRSPDRSVTQLTSRGIAQPATRDPMSSSGRRVVRKLVARFVPLTCAVAFLLFGVPALTKALTPASSRALSPIALSIADTSPTTTSVVTSTLPTSTSVVSSTALEVDAPPTVAFDCPVPGAGWVASLSSTQYVADSSGYHVWYRLTDANWSYWGLFKSGISAPPAIGYIAAGQTVNLLIKRDFIAPDSGTSSSVGLVSPSSSC